MSERQIYSNNASSLLTVGLDTVVTSLTVSPGDGDLFPLPGSISVADEIVLEFFLVTLEDAGGNIEVVKCTERVGDVLTIERGVDGTAPRSWLIGDRVELRQTRDTNERFLQRDGDVLFGGTF